jgi:rhamnosyltransferase subunit B
MTRKIILTTVGTLGDLHPFLALASGLRARGFTPVLGCPEDHVSKARASGIDAVAIFPGFDEVCARMGLGKAEATRRILSDQRQMFEQMILPALSDSAEKLDKMAAGASAIVTSPFVLAAPIIAEKRGLPLVATILQPMALLSALDPPNTRDFAMMKHGSVGLLGAGWNRTIYATMRRLLDALYGRHISAVRREHGLSAAGGARIFDAARSAALTLGLYSPLFAPLPKDAPPGTELVGFPFFDSETGRGNELEPALAAFLSAGPPPVVFTLGTFAVHAAGDFYVEAGRIARALGLRAILLTGAPGTATSDGLIFRCGYAPHSRLFSRAAAIVHHGGIGTVGQALRAGKPQFVVPQMGDQNDHAYRIANLGVGRTLKPSKFAGTGAISALAALLGDVRVRERASTIGTRMSAENAELAAASAIDNLLSRQIT